MAISTSTTWCVGDLIVDKDENYNVSLFRLGGIPVRCLTVEDADTPIAVIIHVLGHGDWVFFNMPEFYSRSMIPRILNKWSLHKESTVEETERVQEILSKAHGQASKIMASIDSNK
jgi:hypothetical protein